MKGYLEGALFLFVFMLSLTSGSLASAGGMLAIDATLQAGLPVYFVYDFYRTLGQMPSDASMVSRGEPGQVVPLLDHQFGDGVFDSRHKKGVGVFMKGYLRLVRTGLYRFFAMANDGIRVQVAGKTVVLDPAFHSDRLSETGEISISQPGWYPLTVKYFQRKGTARLTLYWLPPGATDFTPIPAGAYGH